jgi:hypothetical protein
VDEDKNDGKDDAKIDPGEPEHENVPKLRRHDRPTFEWERRKGLEEPPAERGSGESGRGSGESREGSSSSEGSE